MYFSSKMMGTSREISTQGEREYTTCAFSSHLKSSHGKHCEFQSNQFTADWPSPCVEISLVKLAKMLQKATTNNPGSIS